MPTKEIPLGLELYAIRLQTAGRGKYIPRQYGDGTTHIFFKADTPEGLQSAIKEMERRKHISEALKKNRYSVLLLD
jgi:hypothetical protein